MRIFAGSFAKILCWLLRFSKLNDFLLIISAGSGKMWRNASFFVAFPAIALCGLNVYLDHKNHPHEPPEFIKYEHLRIRTKRFPW